jgi:hypothetical protein
MALARSGNSSIQIRLVQGIIILLRLAFHFNTDSNHRKSHMVQAGDSAYYPGV